MIDINLNELTLDNIGSWPKPIKLIVVVVAGLVLLALAYWLLLKPKYESLANLKKVHADLRAEFEQKQHRAVNLNKYKKQLVEIKHRFGKMLKQLPSKNEMDALLEDISKTGIASGLSFQLFDPSEEVEHDFYVELPINIQVTGSYHQLAVFLSRVAAMSRIVTLHDLKITHKKEKKGQPGVLTMQIIAKIYRYRTL